LSLDFQIKLNNLPATFSNEELEDGLRFCFVDFIEQRLEFNQLIIIIESLKKNYSKQLSKKFLKAVNTLYELNKELNDPTKEQVSNEQITLLVDDLLDSCNGIVL